MFCTYLTSVAARLAKRAIKGSRGRLRINISATYKLFTNKTGKYYSRHPLSMERSRNFTALPPVFTQRYQYNIYV